MTMAVARLVNQGKRTATVKVPGHHSAQITTREVRPTVASSERIARFTGDVFAASAYTSPREAVQVEIETRYETLKIAALEMHQPAAKKGADAFDDDDED